MTPVLQNYRQWQTKKSPLREVVVAVILNRNSVTSRAQISAVLLAAGESRRMGDTNKLELSIAGVPLIRHMAQTLLASSLQEIIVVVGHQSDRMRQLLDGLAVTIVDNEVYQQGQMTSVYAGLQALQPCEGVMICLTDQPLLTSRDIDQLSTVFINRNRGSVLVPMYHGKRGNPIILAYQHRKAILAGDRKLGCKRLIEHNPELVTAIEMENDHTVVDMDTLDDYAALKTRLVNVI
jgi:molybdenum cofactor cytidylyltransferase